MDNEAETLLNVPEIHIGTQGLRKRILQKGTSWQTPSPGDEVGVHYCARLEDGRYFDSSHDKDTSFKFRLGQGEVIKGWDEGIVTMRKGERAVFTIPSELAYGDVGSPPLIPPNTTLIFDIEMVSWNTVRDITGDGGIIKKIIKDGEGWATPKDADEVLVKYAARSENGDVVSRSDGGTEFSLTNGYLCPAMSRAVKTMRKGEKAEISIKLSYGISCPGKENASTNHDMLSNSISTIDLELVSWKTVVDVMGDKKVLKKVIKIGEGFGHPNEGSIAKVVYTGKLEDGTVFEEKGSDEEPYEYICSAEQINGGLDRAIMTMRKGEQAIVRVNSQFLSCCAEVGESISGSSVLYEIKLVEFTKEKPFWKMDTQEKLDACARKKQDGNELFRAGKFQQASKKYDKALQYVDYDHSFNDDEKRQANALRLSCNLNNAACKLKLGEYLEASELCTKVLELDPCNIKALFRRSQAYLTMSEHEKAENDLKRALAIDPKNREVKVLYNELKDKQRQYIRLEAEFFINMLSRGSKGVPGVP